MLNKNGRRYAQAMHRLNLGIWGFPVKQFFAIHLTTREGDDNSPERFVFDFRKLVKWWREDLGYDLEYCVALGLTPDKGLVHGHGLVRVKGCYLLNHDKKVRRRMLGDKWNEIHNAFAVQVTGVSSASYFGKYITKHIMKDYMNSPNFTRNQFLVSRGWRRKIPCSLVDDIKDWYLQGIGAPWLNNKGWWIVRKLIRSYCEGEACVIADSFGYCIMDKQGRLAEAVIYEMEV